MKYEIKAATACYTGGGIYIYYGQLENDLFFMSCDTWESILVLNADPSCEESQYPEYQEQHYIEELINNDYKTFLNKMLRHIVDGGAPYDNSHNYSTHELKERIIK